MWCWNRQLFLRRNTKSLSGEENRVMLGFKKKKIIVFKGQHQENEKIIHRRKTIFRNNFLIRHLYSEYMKNTCNSTIYNF